MPIWFYVLTTVVVGSIIAVNAWLYRLPADERRRLDAIAAEDMRNFSM